MSRICMVGTGYVGLVTGACLADFGHQVACVDSNVDRIAQLRRLSLPFFEPGLEDLVAKNAGERRLTFTTELPAAVRRSQVIFIAVGTPQRADGSTDLSAVHAVARQIAPHLTGHKVIVQKSTVPPGTSRSVAEILKKNLMRGS